MQWYGQDSVFAASSSPTAPFDFSAAPPDIGSTTCMNGRSGNFDDSDWLAPATNFFFYHVLGNVGFIGYTGREPFAAQEAHFKEACEYFQSSAETKEVQVQEVVLMGHWSDASFGCDSTSWVGDVQAEIRNSFAETPCANAKAFYGHQHCNCHTSVGGCGVGGHSGCTQELKDVCFEVGATGKTDNACDNHWGTVYFDSTLTPAEVWYLQLGDATSDKSKPLLDCLSTKSIAVCAKAHGTRWFPSPGSQ
jgi:hypothetical protein